MTKNGILKKTRLLIVTLVMVLSTVTSIVTSFATKEILEDTSDFIEYTVTTPLTLAPFVVYAGSDFDFEEGSGTIMVYNGSGGDVEIPREINDVAVTVIGDGAFNGKTNLTSVIIPDSITHIGSSAFSGCSSLASITVPDSVISIGDSAFKNCPLLTIYGRTSSTIADYAEREKILFVDPYIQEKVLPVTADPTSGEVMSGTSVTLSTSTDGAEIRYTTDGSSPTDSSTLYQSPIIITTPTTIKTMAFKSGLSNSEESIYTYTLSANENPILAVDTAVGSAGDEVDIAVSITNNPGIAGIRLNLDFDNTKLEPISISCGAVLLPDNISSNLQQEGDLSGLTYISAVWHSPSDVKEDGVLYTVKFRIKDEATSKSKVPLNLSLVDITNQDYASLPVDIVPGAVNIITFVYGDIYVDGDINTKDLVRLAQHLASWPVSLTPEELRAADVLYDGTINGKDAVKLSQFLASWPVVLGEEEL